MSSLALIRGLVVADAKQIFRDRFLGFILGYTIFLALVVRFGVPSLADLLARRYGIDMVPYYGLVSSFVGLTLGASMVGIVLGFLLLDARETRVVDALSVTPLTFERFLSYRVGLPMVLAVALNPICAAIGGIGLPALFPMVFLALLGVLFAGIGTLALATFADNKIQAFAVMKLISGVSMLPVAAYFIPPPWQLLAGLFPPYWIFKAWWVAVDGGAAWGLYALIGLAANVFFLGWMKRRFEAAVHRG